MNNLFGMLTIRKKQKRILEVTSRQRFIDQMCDHLRIYFPDRVVDLDRKQLFLGVEKTIGHARAYQLTSRQDVCRFLNLGAYYGWDFDTNPDLAWMRAFLDDPNVSNHSHRLALLVDECKRRQGVEAHNRKLREAFRTRKNRI